MENECGITVTNKYALFQVLQSELEKATSKKEKQKTTSGKEKEIKPLESNLPATAKA